VIFIFHVIYLEIFHETFAGQKLTTLFRHRDKQAGVGVVHAFF